MLVNVVWAAAAGVLMHAAFPGLGWWWCAPLSCAVFFRSLQRVGWRGGALLGFIFGVVFFGWTLSWSGIFVGVVPWTALAILQSLYTAACGALCAWWMSRVRVMGLPDWLRPVGFVGCWLLTEWLRSTTPYGGFPWLRVAFSQADSWWAGVAAWGGSAGLTCATVGLGAVAGCWLSDVWAWVQRGCRPSPATLRRWALVGVACLVGVLAVQFLPRGTSPSGKVVRVAVIQGNVPRAGLDFNAERRAVLDNHVAVTKQLGRDVAAGLVARPDVVIWPENSSDIDPLLNSDAGAVIEEAVRSVGVPVLVGAVLDGPGNGISNATLVFIPDRQPPLHYVKQHPVPFAEYIPAKSFFRLFSDKVDYVRRDFVGGSEVGFVSMPLAGSERYGLGLSICFEVAYDPIMADSVRAGAQVLSVQTNNATFGFTDESAQQLAISRMRAIEHGRVVAHASNVGESAVVLPSGEALGQTGKFTAAYVVRDAPLVDGLTWSDRLRLWPELCGVALMVGALVAVAPRRCQRRRGNMSAAHTGV